MQAAWLLAPLAFVVADLLMLTRRLGVVWKLGIVLIIGYALIGICDGVQTAAAAAGLEVGGVAAGVADRHGHHLLAGPVQRGPVK